jgi:hypothetical protein
MPQQQMPMQQQPMQQQMPTPQQQLAMQQQQMAMMQQQMAMQQQRQMSMQQQPVPIQQQPIPPQQTKVTGVPKLPKLHGGGKIKNAVMVFVIFILLNSRLFWKQIMRLPFMGTVEPSILALIVNSLLAALAFYLLNVFT